MNHRKDTEPKQGRASRYKVSGQYDNAYHYGQDMICIESGDTCVVNPDAPYRDGDLVLANCSARCTGAPDAPHYHAQYYRVCRGQKYKFRLNEWPNRQGGRRFKDGQESIIVGKVINVIKAKANKNAKPSAAPSGKLYVRVGYYLGFDATVQEGSQLVIELGRAANIGDIIGVCKGRFNPEGNNVINVYRVVGGDSKTVRAVDQADNYLTIGRQSILGSVVEIQRKNADEIAALRERLAWINEDDITDSTARLALERQIYNLEHPPEEEDDFDWPDEISDDGRQAR